MDITWAATPQGEESEAAVASAPGLPFPNLVISFLPMDTERQIEYHCETGPS